ncbi:MULTISPECIES: HPF/RaiA family ribosome-associated protein [unclassified Pseudofrankia]|uniref:HPF/RaiA family ribosome-associated protein n=1 Tax=unclassified Pseudofrankia TaxID=2994372 RepID=UPI0009F352F9|nr:MULTISPECIES: HPF/RaiA family ribosome-associated protein [unclassified Pseudofrankia]MDT3445459.1 HPF/RaiA family ribosome-associated protein [Pseudofrankia sp. BMG5.37]
MTSTSRLGPGTITVQITGPVSQPARDYAVEKVNALAQLCHEPILHARISLDAGGRPGTVPASAAVSLDVNGTPVRARAEGTTLREAIDLLQARLRTRLLRYEDRPHRGQPVRTGPSARPEDEHEA